MCGENVLQCSSTWTEQVSSAVVGGYPATGGSLWGTLCSPEVTGWHKAQHIYVTFNFHGAPDTKASENKDAFPPAPQTNPERVKLVLCVVNSECAGAAPWHLNWAISPRFVLLMQHVTTQGFFTQLLCHCWTDLDLKRGSTSKRSWCRWCSPCKKFTRTLDRAGMWFWSTGD